MQVQIQQPQEKEGKAQRAWFHFVRSNYVTWFTDWFLVLGGKSAQIVLVITTLYMSAELYPGVNLPDPLNIAMFIIQMFALDVGGMGLASLSRQARTDGNPEGANKAQRLSTLLIGVMIAGIVTVCLEQAIGHIPHLSKDAHDWIDAIKLIIELTLVVTRAFCAVLYGVAIHELKTDQGITANKIEELNTQLNTKIDELNTLTAHFNTQRNTQREEVNTLTAQLNDQRNTLEKQLNTGQEEVNALRIEVNTLRVKLSSKDEQLASVKGAHEGSLGAIQEATSSVKSQLADAYKEVESVRSLLLKAQGSLHTEKQKVLSLTSEIEQLNTQCNTLTTQLNTKGEEVNTLTKRFNTQLNTLEKQLSTKQEEVNTLTAQLNTQDEEADTGDKILQLDTQRENRNFEPQVRDLLSKEPGLSGREIARRIKCAPPTACRLKKLIEEEAAAS